LQGRDSQWRILCQVVIVIFVDRISAASRSRSAGTCAAARKSKQAANASEHATTTATVPVTPTTTAGGTVRLDGHEVIVVEHVPLAGLAIVASDMRVVALVGGVAAAGGGRHHDRHALLI
jgi:hypothetical protein